MINLNSDYSPTRMVLAELNKKAIEEIVPSINPSRVYEINIEQMPIEVEENFDLLDVALFKNSTEIAVDELPEIYSTFNHYLSWKYPNPETDGESSHVFDSGDQTYLIVDDPADPAEAYIVNKQDVLNLEEFFSTLEDSSTHPQ